MVANQTKARRQPRKQLPSALLRLNRYWIEEIQYSGSEASESSMEDVPLVGETEVLQLDRGYLVRLDVKSRQRRGQQVPLKFRMKLAGYYTLSGELEEEQASHLAYVNGSAMLYSLGRVILAMIRGVGQADYQLPAINFASFLESAKERPRRSAEPKPPEAATRRRKRRPKPGSD